VVLVIVSPFPAPPPQVRHALNTLAVLRTGDKDAIAELGDIADLPRPWDPASCHNELRHHLWLWCDDVATWVNREYVWRSTSLIPSCWDLHPHIAREIPVLACLRVAADDALTPDMVEEWHRHTLPLFLDRLAARLGESSCRSGKHADWPAAGRYDAFTSRPATIERKNRFHIDTRLLQQLRSPVDSGN
jgi:hypothetical protein